MQVVTSQHRCIFFDKSKVGNYHCDSKSSWRSWISNKTNLFHCPPYARREVKDEPHLNSKISNIGHVISNYEYYYVFVTLPFFLLHCNYELTPSLKANSCSASPEITSTVWNPEIYYVPENPQIPRPFVTSWYFMGRSWVPTNPRAVWPPPQVQYIHW